MSYNYYSNSKGIKIDKLLDYMGLPKDSFYERFLKNVSNKEELIDFNSFITLCLISSCLPITSIISSISIYWYRLLFFFPAK